MYKKGKNQTTGYSMEYPMILNTSSQAGAYRLYAPSLLQIYLILGPLRDLVKMSASWLLELKNQARGDCFRPYRERHSLHTKLGSS